MGHQLTGANRILGHIKKYPGLSAVHTLIFSRALTFFKFLNKVNYDSQSLK